MKFIDDDKTKGLLYNYKEINKEYKKLKCPSGYYDPTHLPFDKAKYFIPLSVRSTGKTVNILLWAMCQNKLYGTTIVYLRQSIEMIMPKNVKDMFRVIVDCGYVEKLTNDKYNSIIYKARRFYYCKVDQTGAVEEIAPNHFCICLAISNAMELKSSFNDMYADCVIFDEFISDKYSPNEFFMMCDVLSTIFRERLSGIVFMLANTIDKNSPYFRELDVYDSVKTMDFGDSKIITSPLGTKLFVEIIKLKGDKVARRNRLTELFFGFSNPRLASITGSLTWAVNNYQHIPLDLEKNVVEIVGNRYIFYNDEFVRLRVVHSEKYGIVLLINRATRIYGDSIVYTIGDIRNYKYRFGLGFSKVDSIIMDLFQKHKVFYQSNDIGSFVDNYLKEWGKKIM